MEVAPPPNTPEFAAWLRGKRLEREPKIAQEKLAAALGVDRKQPQRWEKGGGITVTNYLRVVAYFGAEPPADVVPPDLVQRIAAMEGSVTRMLELLLEIRNEVKATGGLRDQVLDLLAQGGSDYFRGKEGDENAS